MPPFVLGFDCYIQDSAAALLHDGQLICAVEQERLVRRKHTGEFPLEAIRWCLSEAGITPADLGAVAFQMRPWKGVGQRAAQIVRGLPGSLKMLKTRGGPWSRIVRLKQTFARQIGAGPYAWHWVRHHDAHAASAFYPSPFERAAVLVVDGSGEIDSTTAYLGEGRQLTPLWNRPFPHSLGYFYSALTEYLGFTPAGAEGKVMGLSSYGEPDPALMPAFRQMISDDGHIDPSWFRFQEDGIDAYYGSRWIEAFGPPRVAESELCDRHHALAASGQARLEEVLFALLRQLHADTGADAVCLAGGVALNCVANGRICAETPFSRVWVQPVAHDAGAGLGAAMHVHMGADGARFPMNRVDFGPRYDGAAIDAAVARAGLVASTVADPAEAGAELLAQGHVVGWFEGGLELGPRALGHRSILADPRDPGMPDRVNARVKRREGFRPFAPAVLAERASDWFDGTPTPFMTTVHRVLRPDVVPAITHVDGTARVQSVDSEGAPAFWSLIRSFEERTGVPIVLNTSFNIRGEPIVCTPAEAIADFVRTDMDALVLEDRVLQKRG